MQFIKTYGERELECRCRNYARQQGWVCWKNENNGNKGIPDDSFLSPTGRFLLVEFKTTRGRLRKEQKIWQSRFPDIVKIVRTFKEFSELLQ